jgi:ribose 5-phosphate isomerase B
MIYFTLPCGLLGGFMKIGIASDHAGFELKRYLKGILITIPNIQIEDYGTDNNQLPVDYPDFAKLIASEVSKGNIDRGILICGTGMGMCIVANKFKNVRATVCYNEITAQFSRKHNDSNILCLGARLTTNFYAGIITKIWLNTKFESQRHAKRLNKIKMIDEGAK